MKFFDYSTTIAAFQFILFSFYLLFTARGKRISNFILAFILLTLAIHLAGAVYPFYIFNSIMFVIIPPAFYFYTKSLIYKKLKFQLLEYLHLLPAAIYALMIFVGKFIFNVEDILKLNLTAVNIQGVILYDILTDIQLLVYILWSIFSIKDFKNKLHQEYSSIQMLNLNWLRAFASFYLFAWYFGSLIYYLENFSLITVETRDFLAFLNIYMLVVLSIYVVYRGLKHPELFNGIEEKPKYQSSSLDRREKDRILNKLLDLMKNEKPYLKPAITLKELAEKLDISAKNLSQVINESLDKNFYDFINQYRVEEAKKNICSNDDKTFLEILFEAGFNSKAVFNSAFKKHAGMTPREYKKVNLN